MTSHCTIGKINSIQSLGTLDGPGVRFVVFMQGCNLRCGCCHNPDTWSLSEGSAYSADQLLAKVVRFREYFGAEGGITVSGGEPLMQAEFVEELFELCHSQGINTCLDTSGSILNDSVKRLLKSTDRVLLDIKYTDDEKYRQYVGCSMQKPLEFLSYLNSEGIPTTLRQVIIPTLNDSIEDIQELKRITKKYTCVDKIELLPFKKICQVKYDKLGITFPFAHLSAPTSQQMTDLESVLYN